MFSKQLGFTLGALLAVCPSVLLASGAADQVSVSEAYVRAVPPGQPNSAGFMVLTNRSGQSLVLKDADSPIARSVELHTHTMQGGMMRMRQVEQIELPAGEQVALQPGGHHVMFIGLNQELMPGQKVDVTLKFADGSSLPLQVPVVKLQLKMKQGGMKHNMGTMPNKAE